jgi:hypothetical protein
MTITSLNHNTLVSQNKVVTRDVIIKGGLLCRQITSLTIKICTTLLHCFLLKSILMTFELQYDYYTPHHDISILIIIKGLGFIISLIII